MILDLIDSTDVRKEKLKISGILTIQLITLTKYIDFMQNTDAREEKK